MKNTMIFLGIGALLLLAGCSGPSDKEVGQAVLLVTPTVFLVSLGFQYLFFGPSFLTILFIIMRVWLTVKPSKVFTWVTIIVMSFYVLLALPLATGLAEGSSFSEFVIRFWIIPGMLPFWKNDFGWPGLLTAIVFLILLVEVLIRIKRTRRAND